MSKKIEELEQQIRLIKLEQDTQKTKLSPNKKERNYNFPIILCTVLSFVAGYFFRGTNLFNTINEYNRVILEFFLFFVVIYTINILTKYLMKKE